MAAVPLLYGGCRLRSFRATHFMRSIPAQQPHYSGMRTEQLFDYTSGRWLYNEKLRLSERRLCFNVDALRQTVAKCLGAADSDVKTVSKLAEGGFNRVFEVAMADGRTVLARLPYPSTQPHRYAIASEVATLDLLRSHGMPVPKVLHYSTDPENRVGVEYMILEKLPGRPLGDRWYDLSETQRLKIISQVVQLEAKLSEIYLPAYGSIYHGRDLPDEVERVPISTSHPNEGFCVGPSTALSWWYGKRESLRLQRGPFRTPLDLLLSIAKKELAWLSTFGQPRFPFERAYRESTDYQQSSPSEHADSLRKFTEIAPYLIPNDSQLHRPMLRHPDLQPNNIFCTDDLEIVGLIDWQHSNILPQFLAAGIPTYFANYQDEESLRFVPPKLPTDFRKLSEEERLEASEVYRRRHLHFYYLGFTQRFNPSHFQALHRQTDLLIRKTFEHASQPWEGNNIPLRSDLIHLTQIWSTLLAENVPGTKSVSTCPIHFIQAEQGRILNSLKQQEDTDTQLEAIRNIIGVGVDGWVPNSEFDNAVDRARLVKEQALQNLDNEKERELTLHHWPFDNFDEEE